MGSEGLDHHFALHFTTPGTARHLGEQLEGALAGAEVGQVKPDIGQDDADQGHRLDVQPLGHHLRTQEDIRFPPAKALHERIVSTLPSGSVDIHTNDANTWKLFQQRLLYLLSPNAFKSHFGAATAGTYPWHRAAVVAVVAAHVLALTAVVGEGDVAVAAPNGLATGGAADGWRKAPAVLQQDDLLPSLQAFSHFEPERAGKEGALLSLEGLAAHVNHVDSGQGTVVDARGQAQGAVLAHAGVPVGLQTGRGRPENDRGAGHAGANHGQVAGRIGERLSAVEVVLDVRPVVLLVHDNDPHVLHRRQNG